jgi:hypothetical protein
MFIPRPTTFAPSPTPQLAYTDYTPAGPWADGQVVTRNYDGVGFTYSASLNALTVNPNLSASVKDANSFIVQNLPAPTNGGDAANKTYVDSHAGSGGGIPDAPSDGSSYGRLNAAWTKVLPLAGGTLTGPLIQAADPVAALGTATKQYADKMVPLAGGTMTGLLTLSGVPSATNGAATKGYVDTAVPPSSTATPAMDGTGAAGTATTYSRGDHVHPTDTSRAPLASPNFSGTPQAPTATAGTNTIQLATTAFVGTALTNAAVPGPSGTTPIMDGTGAAGVAVAYSRGDHVHPSDTSRAPLASPALTGVPLAPTATALTNNTQIATTGYADSAVSVEKTRALAAEALLAPLASPALTGTPTGTTPSPGDNSTKLATTAFVAAATGGAGIILRSYLAGLTLSTAGGSTTFSVAVGQATEKNNTAYITLASAISKTTAAWVVGTGNGALDTGTIAINTWYHVHEIERPDTSVVDVAVSLSATAPTTGGNIPAAYTLSRRIGAMKTDGSSNWWLFSQVGDKFIWAAPVRELSAVSIPTAATAITLSGIPTGFEFDVEIRLNGVSGTNQGILIQSFDETSAAASNATPNYNTTAVGSNSIGTQLNLRTSTSAQLRWSAAASVTASLQTVSWIDTRGKLN